MDDLFLLLLCGECHFKVYLLTLVKRRYLKSLVADTAPIDRKIRFCVAPKTNVALKILREQLSNVLAQQYQGKILTQEQEVWKELGLLAWSKTKIKQERDNFNDVAVAECVDTEYTIF